MSIPKRNRSETIAGTGWAHYLKPHVKVGVDTNNSSVTSNLIDKILDVVAVEWSWFASPAASSLRVRLDIKPYHSIVSWSESRDELVHLVSCRLRSAGEHVDINVLNSSCSCVIHVGRAVGVEITIWHIWAGDCEIHSIVLQALVGANWLKGWIVDSSGSKNCWYIECSKS